MVQDKIGIFTEKRKDLSYNNCEYKIAVRSIRFTNMKLL